jgi:hypothetical protein
VPRYQVIGSVTFDFDIEVTAADEDAAERLAQNKDFPDLIERAPMPRIEVDGCLEVPKRKKK